MCIYPNLHVEIDRKGSSIVQFSYCMEYKGTQTTVLLFGFTSNSKANFEFDFKVENAEMQNWFDKKVLFITGLRHSLEHDPRGRGRNGYHY